MAEIRQELTFDASSAISELDRLTQSLQGARTSLNNFGRAVANFTRNSGGAVATINSLATASSNLQSTLSGGIIPANATSTLRQSTGLVDQFGRSLSSTSTAAKDVGPAAAGAGDAIKETGNRAGKAKPQVQSLSVSFATLGKLLLTRLALSAFSGFIQGLKNSVSSAIEFQKTVAEVQSISVGLFTNLDATAGAIRRVSDAFNQPLGEVGEGLYQVISNQIKGASAQIAVLESSSVLAKVGVADLSSTVELLTGTINAFELNAGNAEQISAVFFETVRLGRTRISELSQSFGTVAALAAEAGLEFEELAGAFAAVTINGLDTSKAATQLRGIINAFIKPTKEMSKVLTEAGFSSGEMAIQVLGLGGALALLQDFTGGNVTELAKLIPRVRGLSGALVLARNGGETLNKTVDALRKSTSQLLQEKLEIKLETNAEQVERAINKVSNALTVDLGQALLEVINTFGVANIAADAFVGTIRIFGPALITLGGAVIFSTVALGGYVLATKIAAINTTALAGLTTALTGRLVALGFSANFAGAALATIGVGALIAGGLLIGFQIGKGLIAALERQADRAGERAAKALNKRLINADLFNLEKLEEDTETQIRAIKNVTKEQIKFLNEVRRAEKQREQTFLDTNSAILADTEKLFSTLLSINKKLIKDLEKERDAADDAATDSLKRQGDIRANIEDRAFKNTIRTFSERSQLFANEQRGAQLATKANEQLADAQNAGDADAAIAAFERADGFLAEAESIARSTGNAADLNRVFQTRQRILQGALAAEQAFEQAQKKRRDEAEAALKEERTRVEALGQAVGTIQEQIRKFESSKDPAERFAILAQLRKDLGDLTPEVAFGTTQFNFADLVSFTTFRKNLVDSVEALDLGTPIADLLTGAKITDINLDFSAASAKSVIKGVREAEAELNARGLLFRARIDLELIGSDQLQAIQNQIAEASQTAQTGLTSKVQDVTRRDVRNRAGETAIADAARSSSLLNTATSFLSGAIAINDEEARQFGATITRITTEALTLGKNLENVSFGRAELSLENLESRLAGLVAASRAADVQTSRTLIIQLQALLTNLRTANQTGLTKTVQDAATVNKNLEAIPTSAEEFTNDLSQAIPVAQTINGLLSNVGPTQVAATGGQFSTGRFMKFFAGGGFSPRGTDTIPAMLSPGEFVVNARSSRRFFSQLQAINAGVKPVFRQDGGSVTNVGDINVTVGAGRESASTGRQIARSIRRELRRGTSSL